MIELKFKLRPVYKKPRSAYKSIYDDVINNFLNCSDTIAEVKYDNISPYSIRLQLSNRIKKRRLVHKLRTYVKNRVVFLEKLNETGYKIYLKSL